tara:strand:- start:506 stop:1105 length:600 start_codon:yes stop_codon:yes gene_type:complete
MARNTKPYPEFTVPSEETRGASGIVESTTLDFTKETFSNRVGQIELKRDGEVEKTENASDFWDRLKTTQIGQRDSSQVKFRKNLRGVGGKFISSAEQETVVRRYESKTGNNFNKLSDKKQKDVFENELLDKRENTIVQDLDRIGVVDSIAQRFDANPFYLLEIKGSDGKARTYTNKETGINALNQQLNRFYQSVGEKES